jgi:hypothetical protein
MCISDRVMTLFCHVYRRHHHHDHQAQEDRTPEPDESRRTGVVFDAEKFFFAAINFFSAPINFFSAAENLLTGSVTVFCDLETDQFLLREAVLSVKAGRYGCREFVYSLN